VAGDVGATLCHGAGAAIATALASTLDNHCLKALAGTAAGRELLDVLRTGAPSQVDRIRDALHSGPQRSANWADSFANQVLHARVLDAVSLVGTPAQ